MALEVTGVITKILDKQTGTSKAGKEWEKLSFVVDNNEQYNNIFCFELFGKEKVENFEKYNKVGQSVKVDFNVNTNDWTSPQGDLKYFTTLQAWKVFKADVDLQQAVATIDEAFKPAEDLKKVDDDLPF